MIFYTYRAIQTETKKKVYEQFRKLAKYSNRRVSKSDKPMCTLIDYRALANRKFPNLKNKIFSQNGMKANKVQ